MSLVFQQKSAGKQMQSEGSLANCSTRGPAIVKLHVPSTFLVPRTRRHRLSAYQGCHLPTTVLTGTQTSARHGGASSCRHFWMIIANLYVIQWRTGSEWSSRSAGEMWWNCLATVTAGTAALWTICSFVSKPSLTPYNELQHCANPAVSTDMLGQLVDTYLKDIHRQNVH